MACASQVVNDEDGDPCLLRYYRRGTDLDAGGELLVALGLRQLEHLHRVRWDLR